MRRIIATVLIVLLCLGTVAIYRGMWERRGIGPGTYSPEFFGIGEPVTLRTVYENLSIQRCFEALRSLGVRRLREWTWMGALLRNQTCLNQTFKETLDLVIAEMGASNISILGMSHDFPRWMTGIENDPQAVPWIDRTPESRYMKFLEIYRQSWKTMAEAFPNITMWEIGNEFNTDLFLHPEGYVDGLLFSPRFTVEKKAEVTTDLLYYGSLGVHEANPKANTVLGGLAPYPNIYGIADFLDRIYRNIESGRWPSIDPDDFFEIVSWHPYISERPTSLNWVEPNKAVYDIMKRHGDQCKPVVFSELGFRGSDGTAALHLIEAFELAKAHFPWLVTIYWFRLVEPSSETVSISNPKGYGIIELDWQWKAIAYAYYWLIKESST